MAPAAALATAGVSPAARWRGSTTPVTPAVSALRITAPRFWGSVTPSSATRNAAGIGEQLVEVGRRDRRGERDHALRRLGAGTPLHLVGRAPRTRTRAVLRETRDLVEHLEGPCAGREPELAHPAPPGRERARAPHGGPSTCCPRSRCSPSRLAAASRGLIDARWCRSGPSSRTMPRAASSSRIASAAAKSRRARASSARERARRSPRRRARMPARRRARARARPARRRRSRRSDAAARVAVVDAPGWRRDAGVEDRRDRARRVEVVVHRRRGTLDRRCVERGGIELDAGARAARRTSASSRRRPRGAARARWRPAPRPGGSASGAPRAGTRAGRTRRARRRAS